MALIGLVCTALFVTPGLVLHGTASLGWHQGISIIGYLDLAMDEAEVSISSDIAPGITINADSNRIQQVVDSLLSNALKFTPPTGTVAMILRRVSMTTPFGPTVML